MMDTQPLSDDGYRAGMGVTESVFVDTQRCTLELVAGCARRPGGLQADDLDALAEAAWATFVDNMREACLDGQPVLALLPAN